jgi:hypothetical protein
MCLPKFGFLRASLIVGTVCLICLGPFADGRVVLDSWRLIPTVVAPALMCIVLFVLSLDMTMARAFMSGAEDGVRARLRRIIRIEGILFIALVLAWIPFFLKITSPVD